MGLEAATYIHQLNAANPVGGTDPVAQGDDHLRMIKATLQTTFPNITGAMTATQAALNGITTLAAPSVKVKATGAAGAGVALSAMRTDAQLLLDVADTYAWTGQHSWTLSLLGHGSNTPAAPAFAFAGDTDTGIYRTGSGQVAFSTNSVNTVTIYDGGIQVLVSTAKIYGQDGTVGAPGYTFQNDPDCGLYRISANRIGIAVGGARIFDILTSVAEITVPIYLPDGGLGAPSYTFSNDTDTGIYRAGTNDLRIVAGGTFIAGFQLDGSTRPLFFVADGTAAQPSFCFASDPDTGLLKLTADQLGFSEGGASFRIGFREIPQNSQSANYGLTITDNGKHILHPNGAGAGDTFTIPANGSVAYPLGTVLTFVNRDSNALSIAITTDTMILAGTITTGTRSLAQNGIATAIKVESTTWLISGTGLS